MELWIWRNLRFLLPPDWEMLLFSRESDMGRCAFADRYAYRLEVNWRAGSGPPDLDRMTSDYLAKLRLDGTMPDAESVQCGDAYGIQGHQNGVLTSRFGSYIPAERCLVETVFLWPETKNEALEREVMESLGPEPEHDGRFRRWRAFGMDLLATSTLALSACRSDPASVQMTFADSADRRREIFERLGMVDTWLQRPVADWLLSHLPQDVTVHSTSSLEHEGHTIDMVEGSSRPGIFRRPVSYEAAAWVCPTDGRLYCASSRAMGAATGEQRLSCCDDLELAP